MPGPKAVLDSSKYPGGQEMAVTASQPGDSIDENLAVSNWGHQTRRVGKGVVLRSINLVADHRADHAEQGSNPLVRLTQLMDGEVEVAAGRKRVERGLELLQTDSLQAPGKDLAGD
jgi:hypothetical protein